MTNYENIMENMTPEILADLTVQLVCINNDKLFYLTSTGQLFPLSHHNEALRFEYEWLQAEVPSSSNEETAVEESKE